jgi:hypothetical protein
MYLCFCASRRYSDRHHTCKYLCFYPKLPLFIFRVLVFMFKLKYLHTCTYTCIVQVSMRMGVLCFLENPHCTLSLFLLSLSLPLPLSLLPPPFFPSSSSRFPPLFPLFLLPLSPLYLLHFSSPPFVCLQISRLCFIFNQHKSHYLCDLQMKYKYLPVYYCRYLHVQVYYYYLCDFRMKYSSSFNNSDLFLILHERYSFS